MISYIIILHKKMKTKLLWYHWVIYDIIYYSDSNLRLKPLCK